MRPFGHNDLELVEALFAQLPTSPFFIKDIDLRYIAANQAMAELCGVKRARDLIGRRVADFFPVDLAQSYEMMDAEVISVGRPIIDVLHRSVEARGDDAWLLFARAPVRDRDGHCVGVAATARRLRPGLISHASYERLRAVTERLRRQFDQPLGLRELAAAVGTSPSQLERDFLKVFARGPRDFLHSVRMREARRRLEDGDARIADIAQECGYADQSAFTRRFAAEVGQTPTQYRRKMRDVVLAQA